MSAPRYLTIEELAQRSGWSLSTLRRRVRDGQIPVIQPGGPRTRMAFDPDVLDRLVARRAASQSKLADSTPVRNDFHEGIHGSPAAKERRETKDNPKPLSGPEPAWMSGDLFKKFIAHCKRISI